MKTFCCPVCGEGLIKNNKTYNCPNNHSFDISKKGYVNLLMSQTNKNKRHGDDKLMVNARRDFLNGKWYDRLREALFEEISADFPKNGTLLDAGCGECYYTSYFYKKLAELNLEPNVLGVDISKNALEKADRLVPVERAVASIFTIPVENESCDRAVNIFAPHSEEEFYRILKKGGKLIRAVPLPKHLWELKQSVYDKPYENDVEDYSLKGFEIINRREIKYEINLPDNKTINDLFMMTPYYYKTSKEDFEKLKTINSLKTKIEFLVLTYEKI